MKTKQNYLKEFKFFQNLISAVRGGAVQYLVLFVLLVTDIASSLLMAQPCNQDQTYWNNLNIKHLI